jgi:deaminated glutathione amidase
MGEAPWFAGVVQLQSGDVVSENLDACARQLEAAVSRQASLVVLPENFAYFGSEAGKRDVAETIDVHPSASDGPIVGFLRKFAIEHRVTLIAGGMPERSADAMRPFNTALVVGPSGEVAARYRKLHLFDVTLPNGQQYRESAATMPGDECVAVDVNGVRVGLTICYDLRFPDLFRALALRGARVFVVPAAFTQQTGEAHWHVLLRARAIEWQCWVLAAAQTGEHPGDKRTFGHSLIIDPWGKVVAECVSGEGACVAELDLEYQDEVRARLPCASHRREFP